MIKFTDIEIWGLFLQSAVSYIHKYMFRRSKIKQYKSCEIEIFALFIFFQGTDIWNLVEIIQPRRKGTPKSEMVRVY
jgi:NADPH-dependent 7-cyano-7-deazaguanine reductase QueF-like protein